MPSDVSGILITHYQGISIPQTSEGMLRYNNYESFCDFLGFNKHYKVF